MRERAPSEAQCPTLSLLPSIHASPILSRPLHSLSGSNMASALSPTDTALSRSPMASMFPNLLVSWLRLGCAYESFRDLDKMQIMTQKIWVGPVILHFFKLSGDADVAV